MRGKGRLGTAIVLLAGLLVLAAPGPAAAEHSALELITTGIEPSPGSYPVGALFSSPDGRRVIFNSAAPLVPEDVDRCEDIDPETGEVSVFPCVDGYERFNGVSSLLTTGPADPQLNNPMEIAAASKDATRAIFQGTRLVGGDTNYGIYERAGGTTTLLVSTEPLDRGSGPFLLHVSENGRHVFFATTNRLVPEDTDACEDYYEAFAGTIRLATTGVPPIPTPFGSQCANLTRLGISADGGRLFVLTNASITSDDRDTPDPGSSSVGEDIYEWSNGGVRLISTGPAETTENGFLTRISAISRDGRRVFFSTAEQLVASDTDTVSDTYVRFDGETSLLAPPIDGDSSPPVGLVALSTDGRRAIVATTRRFTPEDTDNQGDIYAIQDGSAELLSIGPSGGNADFSAGWPARVPNLPPTHVSEIGTGGASEDAQVVLFSTAERLVAADTDDLIDLYANVDGVTHLVSTGTNDGPGRSFDADTFRSLFVSPDGSRVFFVSNDPLAVEDADTKLDVYEWHAGRTTIVPDGVPTPEDVVLIDDLPRSLVHDGSRVFVQTTAALTSDDLDSDHDLYGVSANAAPDCDAVSASPAVLRPANGRLVRVMLSGASDAGGDDVTIEITGVTQDEPTGRSRDAVPSSAGDEVRLRAERDNKGDGRVYRIEFEATNGHGGSCSDTAKVAVPRKKKTPAVDSAPPSYDSLG